NKAFGGAQPVAAAMLSQWSSRRAPVNIRRINTKADDVVRLLAELRAQLSPSGNVVSEAGRRRTLEVFGEPLSPAQVVERICEDIRRDGLEAVLDYSRKLDQ